MLIIKVASICLVSNVYKAKVFKAGDCKEERAVKERKKSKISFSFRHCSKCLQYINVAKFLPPPFELKIINLILELNKLKLRKVNCFAQSNKANIEEQKCKPESH